MNELGAGISVGVLAALVVFVIYFIGAKLGHWQQGPQSGQNRATRQWSDDDATRVLPNGSGYGSAPGRDAADDDLPRATKNELAGNIHYSRQMIEANRRAATAANGDTVAVLTYIVSAALIAAIAFVFFNNLLLPATIGALTGAIICVALSATYTLKHLDFWPDNATISIINLIVALLASIFMYIGSVQTQRDNMSLNTITDSFEALPFSEGFSTFAVAIGDRVVTFFRDFGLFGFMFLLFMGIGGVIVFTLAAKSLIDVMDWRIFAQFGHFVTDRPMSHSRAVRFQTSKVSHTVTSLVLAIIAVLAATGMLYDAFTWFTR